MALEGGFGIRHHCDLPRSRRCALESIAINRPLWRSKTLPFAAPEPLCAIFHAADAAALETVAIYRTGTTVVLENIAPQSLLRMKTRLFAAPESLWLSKILLFIVPEPLWRSKTSHGSHWRPKTLLSTAPGPLWRSKTMLFLGRALRNLPWARKCHSGLPGHFRLR